MLREIEFRGYSNKLKKTVYGLLVKGSITITVNQKVTYSESIFYIHPSPRDSIQIKEETISEYTGINIIIKNIKYRIYENDIFIGTVKSPNGTPQSLAGNIIFKLGAFYMNVINLQTEIQLLLSDFTLLIIEGKFIEPEYKTKL